MATSQRRAEELSEALYKRERRGVLRLIVEAETHLDAGFRTLAKKLRERLSRTGLSEGEILEALTSAFAEMSPERQRVVEQAIREAAEHGGRIAPELHERIFGPDSKAPEAERPFVEGSPSLRAERPCWQLGSGSVGRQRSID